LRTMKQLFVHFVVISTCATSLLLAQRSGSPPSAADLVQRRVNFLTRELGLSSAQQQQATTIFTNAATNETTLRDSLRTAHQSLSDAIKSNNSAAIDQVSTQIGTLTAQLTSSEAKANAAFYQVLTPDQQSKFSQSPGPGLGGFGRGPVPGRFRGRE